MAVIEALLAAAVSAACVVPVAALVGFAAVARMLKWYMGLGRERDR